MNMINIALLLLLQIIAVPSVDRKTVVGSVVKYDAAMSSRTAQADLILKAAKGPGQYVRLRYAPNGFGFDAPPAKREQLIPKEMLSDGKLVWSFRVHPPRTREEESACSSQAKQYAPGKDGQLIEVERFAAVPGQKVLNTPSPEVLSCFVVESWAQDGGTVNRKAKEAKSQ